MEELSLGKKKFAGEISVKEEESNTPDPTPNLYYSNCNKEKGCFNY